MTRKVLVLCLLSIYVALNYPHAARASQIVLDSEMQFQFARHYIEKREYDRAAQELERLTYFFPDDPRVPEARYMTGWCYLELGNFERARKILWEVHETYRPYPPSGRALHLLGETYRLQGDGREAAHYYERVLFEYPDDEVADEARYRLGWVHMDAGQWNEASSTFQEVSRDSSLKDIALNLSDRSLEGLSLPRKSPAAAGVMAGVLPGLGHAYCGRYHDATVAFILNGAFAWATYEAFRRDMNALGGVLGFLGLGFYTGNIYSAVNCAHRYNENEKRKFLESLSDSLGIYYTGGKGVGLGLNFRF